MPEPLLRTIDAARERTGLARDRIKEAFHAGRIAGMWSAGVRGKGKILLESESVRAWVSAQITEQAYSAPRGERTARQAQP